MKKILIIVTIGVCLLACKKQTQQPIVKLTKNDEVVMDIADVAYQKGDWAMAKKLYLKAQQVDPKNPLIQYRLANIYYKSEELKKANKLLNNLVETSPKDYKPLRLQGNIYLQQGDIDHAMNNYFKVLSLKPDDGKTLSNLGYALDVSRQHDLAMRCYKKAQANMDGENIALENNLAISKAISGEMPEALSILNRLARKNTAHHDVIVANQEQISYYQKKIDKTRANDFSERQQLKMQLEQHLLPMKNNNALSTQQLEQSLALCGKKQAPQLAANKKNKLSKG